MNHIAIFIMLIVIVVIYGLLFRLKNNKVIKTIESFQTNLDGINEIYQSGTPTFFNGNWTSNQSTIIGNTITNTIHLKLKNNSEGIMRFKGKKFNFLVNRQGVITTDNINNIAYKINPNPNIDSYRLSFDIPKNINTAELIPYGLANQTESKSLIFKFSKGSINPKIISMLKNNKPNIKVNSPNIDGNMYSIPSINEIKNYNYRNDALTPVYIDYEDWKKKYKFTTSAADSLIKNVIMQKYNNLINYQLIREFEFANDQKKLAPFSKLYEFTIFQNNQVLDKIKHRRLDEELAENKLLNPVKFYNITTYLYKFDVDKFSMKYDYEQPDIQFTKEVLKPKNGIENIIEDNLSAPNIKSVRKTSNSDFKVVPLGSINNYNKDDVESSIKVDNMINSNVQRLK